MYYWGVGLSMSLVSIIAFDRYRRICTPAKTQYAVSIVKKVIVGAVLVWMMISLRAFLTVDLVTKKITLSVASARQSDIERTTYSGMPLVVSTVHVKTSLIYTLRGQVDNSNDVSESTLSNNLYTTKKTMPCLETTNSATVSLILSNSITGDTIPSNSIKDIDSRFTDHVVVYVGICGFSRDTDCEGYVTGFHIFDLVYVMLIIIVIVFCYSKVIHALTVHRRSTNWLRVKSSKPKRQVNRTKHYEKYHQTGNSDIDKKAAERNETMGSGHRTSNGQMDIEHRTSNGQMDIEHRTSNGQMDIECVELEKGNIVTSTAHRTSNGHTDIEQLVKNTNVHKEEDWFKLGETINTSVAR